MKISTRLFSQAFSASIIFLCFSSPGCRQPADEQTLTADEATILLECHVGTMVNADMEVIDEVVGDEVWHRFTMTGIHTGPLGALPATGKAFRLEAFAITRIADGKIVEDETFWNVLDMYQQLGFSLVPPQAS